MIVDIMEKEGPLAGRKFSFDMNFSVDEAPRFLRIPSIAVNVAVRPAVVRTVTGRPKTMELLVESGYLTLVAHDKVRCRSKINPYALAVGTRVYVWSWDLNGKVHYGLDVAPMHDWGVDRPSTDERHLVGVCIPNTTIANMKARVQSLRDSGYNTNITSYVVQAIEKSLCNE